MKPPHPPTHRRVPSGRGQSVERTTARRRPSARQRPEPGGSPCPASGRPRAGSGMLLMALLRRAPREVYRVFSESDFLAGGGEDEQWQPVATDAGAPRRRRRIAVAAMLAGSGRSRRLRARASPPASAGAGTFDRAARAGRGSPRFPRLGERTCARFRGPAGNATRARADAGSNPHPHVVCRTVVCCRHVNAAHDRCRRHRKLGPARARRVRLRALSGR